MRKIKNTFQILIFVCLNLFALQSFALSFTIPPVGNSIVGQVQTATVREDEDFSDIAQRYDIGYYELFEANPGVDPDNPIPGTMLIIPTQYILPPELHENIVINLAELRLYYQPKGQKIVYIFPLGIGKEDWETPEGTFKTVEKRVDPKWVVPESIYKYRKSIGDEIPRVQPAGDDNPMGRYAMRLSNPTIEIHGNNDPNSVGRRSSAGCIRLYNEDISKLFHMTPIGTQVKIVNHPYKAGWNAGKLFLEAHMPLLEQRLQMGNDVSPAIRLVESYNKTNAVVINLDKISEIAKQHIGVPLSVENDN